jgi:uncharacterized membrane protein
VTNETPRRRLASLDALRGIAVLMMIEQHLGVWLWRGPARGETLADYQGLMMFNAAGGFGAPLFFVLAGAGTALMCGRDRPGLDGILVRRGIGLWLFGLLVNLVTPSWFAWGSFFALQLMGVGIALGPAWRRASDRQLLWVIVAILVALPLSQAWLGTPADLDNPRMRDMSLPGGALRLALAESQYSILPWLSVFVAGVYAGRFIARDELGPVIRLAGASLAVAAAGYGVYLVVGPHEPELLWRAFRLKLGFFPASVTMGAAMLGLAVLVLWLAAHYERWRPLPATHPLVPLGRGSLTIFIIHVPLFRELTRPYGYWRGMSASGALLTIGGFALLSIVACVLWQRVQFRFGAEWVLRKLGG